MSSDYSIEKGLSGSYAGNYSASEVDATAESPFANLPAEVTGRIFSFVTEGQEEQAAAASRGRLSIVCTQWYHIVAEESNRQLVTGSQFGHLPESEVEAFEDSPFTRLPPEIIQQIFSNVLAGERGLSALAQFNQLSAVCTQWYHTASFDSHRVADAAGITTGQSENTGKIRLKNRLHAAAFVEKCHKSSLIPQSGHVSNAEFLRLLRTSTNYQNGVYNCCEDLLDRHLGAALGKEMLLKRTLDDSFSPSDLPCLIELLNPQMRMKLFLQTPARYQTYPTWLSECVRKDEMKLLKGLLESGMPVDLADAQGSTALSVACRLSEIKMAEALLDHGANPNHVEEPGAPSLAISMDVFSIEESAKKTPMFRALTAAEPNADLIRLLLDHGGDPRIGQDEEGRSAREILNERGKTEVLQLLDQHE